MKGDAAYLKLKLKEQFVKLGSENHAMCLLLKITTIFRNSDIQISLNGDVLLKWKLS